MMQWLQMWWRNKFQPMSARDQSDQIVRVLHEHEILLLFKQNKVLLYFLLDS